MKKQIFIGIFAAVVAVGCVRISVASAFQVEDQALENEIYSAWNQIKERKRLDLAIERFLGFLEGRTGSKVPECWERHVRTASFNGEQPAEFEIVWHAPFQATDFNLLVSVTKGIRLEKLSGAWRLSDGESTVPFLGFDSVKGISKYGDIELSCKYIAVDLLKNSAGAVVCFPQRAPSPFKVMLLDNAGDRLWDVDVECQSPTSAPTSPSIDNLTTEIVVESEKVFVYGISRGVCFLECFDLTTGTVVFRFSSHKGKSAKN